MATWKQLICAQMSLHNETFDDVESSTLSADDIKKETDGGYCGGLPFTIWTSARVYFPACYDGDQWVESVARHPDGKPTEQIGGG